MSNVITATGVSCAAHPHGIVLAVVSGTTVACNIRLDEALVRQLGVSLRRALEAQKVLEWNTRSGAQGS